MVDEKRLLGVPACSAENVQNCRRPASRSCVWVPCPLIRQGLPFILIALSAVWIAETLLWEANAGAGSPYPKVPIWLLRR